MIRAQTFVFHPIVLDHTDFYMSLDLLLLLDKVGGGVCVRVRVPLCVCWCLVSLVCLGVRVSCSTPSCSTTRTSCPSTCCFCLTRSVWAGGHLGCWDVRVLVSSQSGLFECACVVFHPIVLDHTDFYMSLDLLLLLDMVGVCVCVRTCSCVCVCQ